MLAGHAYGYQSCPECGLSVPAVQLASGTHVCEPEQLAAHQTARLDAEVRDFLSSPTGQHQLEFAGWLREHSR